MVDSRSPWWDRRRRLSFDRIADEYDRGRSMYAAEAIEWLQRRLTLGRVLDLGAGTGKLTRQVVAVGAEVVAVEPAPHMRDVLARELPTVDVREGSAEAIPLEAASVDAVVVGQAFHWFRPRPALLEIHRVLRPNGGVGLLWNLWDDADPLMHELQEAVGELPREPGIRASIRRLQSCPGFSRLEERAFPHTEFVDPQGVKDQICSRSAFLVATEEQRRNALANVDEVLGDRSSLPLRMITTVFTADSE